jgi:uncharacterized protein
VRITPAPRRRGSQDGARPCRCCAPQAIGPPQAGPSGSVDHLISSDANVLFSAAYRPEAGLRRRLWRLPGAGLITPVHAAEEARIRNLSQTEQRRELEELLGPVEVVLTAASTDHTLFSALGVARQRPSRTARGARCGGNAASHRRLRHFGPYYGKRIEGVLVLPPGEYFSSRTEWVDASKAYDLSVVCSGRLPCLRAPNG